jgi:quercetin dioxygenase-like cupin family protein
VTPSEGEPPSLEEIEDRFQSEGLSPRTWGNAPGDTYEWHDHSYHKVLYCISGSIVFHTPDEDFELGPGDRLDLEPKTSHAATVGPEGVQCIEAPRQAGAGQGAE